LTPPHSTAFVAVHSVQAPCKGPERWQAGRAGSEQLGAPSVVQATQVRVLVAQTGVMPLHWLSSRQATQTPGPFEVSQCGVGVGQCVTSVAVHAAQAPVDKQIGVAGAHSELDEHARHDREVPSQTGFVPLQSPFATQPTQVPDVVSQTGVAPLQRVAFVAEHWPQAPVGSQAGDMPPQSVSAAQARQAWVVVLQTGAVPPHWALEMHGTQVPPGV
jgi:hypothetical protein